MSQELVLRRTKEQVADVFRPALDLIKPDLQALLRHSSLAPEVYMRTIYVALENDRNYKLRESTPDSIILAAMTGGVLGLPVDGVSGQGYLLPFKDNRANVTKAQWCTGYKGFNTLGDRAGITIKGGVYREGDEFDFDDGTNAFVRHRPNLKERGELIAAWAVAERPNRTPIVSVLNRADVLAIKAKSPGARFGGSENPWNAGGETGIGFLAMAEKSAKRRLNRSLPLYMEQSEATQFHKAAVVDERFDEMGRNAGYDRNGDLVEATIDDIGPSSGPPVLDGHALTGPEKWAIKTPSGKVEEYGSIETWRARWVRIAEHCAAEGRPGLLEKYQEANAEELNRARAAGTDLAGILAAAIERAAA